MKHDIFTVLIVWLIMLPTLLIGCTTTSQSLIPGTFYQRDIQFNINGQDGQGVMVVPQASTYGVYATTPGNADMFVITTCHREQKAQNLGQQIKWEYTPTPIENEGGCPVNINSYSVDGENAWGYIDFLTPEATLPAHIICNGDTYDSPGVTVCQAKVGMVEQINFDEPVEVNPPADCPLAIAKDNQHFQFNINGGVCVYAFLGKTSKQIHRFTTLGYSGVLVR